MAKCIKQLQLYKYLLLLDSITMIFYVIIPLLLNILPICSILVIGFYCSFVRFKKY